MHQPGFSKEKRNHFKGLQLKEHKAGIWLHGAEYPHRDSQITQRLGTAGSHYYPYIGKSQGRGGVTDSRIRSHTPQKLEMEEAWPMRAGRDAEKPQSLETEEKKDSSGSLLPALTLSHQCKSPAGKSSRQTR